MDEKNVIQKLAKINRMLDWINRRFFLNLQNEDLECIRDFSLMWNLYEKTTCGNDYNFTNIRNEIAKFNFNIQDFQLFIDYFKNRYIENGQPNDKFRHLNLRPSDKSQLVQDVLLGKNLVASDIVIVCSTIVYRYKCNLIHGLKDIAHINHQRTNFEIANQFMQKFLEIAYP